MIAKGTVRVWVHATKSWQNQLTDVLRPFSYLDHDSTIFKEGSITLFFEGEFIVFAFYIAWKFFMTIWRMK